MNYRVTRLDPYWMKNPILPIVAVLGVGAALALASSDRPGAIYAALGAAAVGGAAILASTQPAVTAVMGVLGLLGGLMTFILFPRSADIVAMSAAMRALSTLLFTVFYAVLMDGVILFIAVLYNLFAGVVGLGGLSIELDAEGEDGGA